MRAMILAAGLGTRLRPITYEMPKPMVPVVNRPVMEHIARLLARHGVAEVIANLQGFQEKPDPAEALSDLANCGIYMFRSEIFEFFPDAGTSKAAGPEDPPGFADWAMDVFPALLDADLPFYSHEVAAYWNDIGNIDELRSGNMDALQGAVS